MRTENMIMTYNTLGASITYTLDMKNSTEDRPYLHSTTCMNKLSLISLPLTLIWEHQLFQQE